MEYQTHRDRDIDVFGTGLVGRIDAAYQEIVDVFGEPQQFEAGKCDVQWNFLWPDGMVATIYNYKDGKNYLGDEGTATALIRDWHVGGKTKEAADRVNAIFKPASTR